MRRRRRAAHPPSSARPAVTPLPPRIPPTPHRLPCPVSTAPTGTRYASANTPATATLPTPPPYDDHNHREYPASTSAAPRYIRHDASDPAGSTAVRAPERRSARASARSSVTLDATAPWPPTRRYAPASTTRNCPHATAVDGRRLRFATVTGSDAAHDHASSGWIARSDHEPATCTGHGDEQPRSRRTQRIDGRGQRIRRQPNVGVDEHENAVGRTAAAASTNRAHAHCLPTHPAGGSPTPRSTTNRGSSATAAAATSKVRSDESSSSTNTRIPGTSRCARKSPSNAPIRAASSRAGTNTASGSETTPPGSQTPQSTSRLTSVNASPIPASAAPTRTST